MNDRTTQGSEFLEGAGWGSCNRTALAGDASTRRYERLARNGRTAIFMDAPPDSGESTERFCRVAEWLLDRGFSAPRILASDHVAGFLIVEDLGDALFARLTASDQNMEAPLYRAATEFLVDLHRYTPPDFVAPLDAAALADLVELTPRWYLAGIGEQSNPAALRLPSLIAQTYRNIADSHATLSLRDFHAENLIWLPERKSLARVGLLDFQDAVSAHPAYDLVSLLQDARRDVSTDIESDSISRYMSFSSANPDEFLATYALLGAQRALRIVGIFARLTLHFGKPHYLNYIPRVWGYLERNLTHPALSALSDAVTEGLPKPTPERLATIREKCGIYPTP